MARFIHLHKLFNDNCFSPYLSLVCTDKDQHFLLQGKIFTLAVFLALPMASGTVITLSWQVLRQCILYSYALDLNVPTDLHVKDLVPSLEHSCEMVEPLHEWPFWKEMMSLRTCPWRCIEIPASAVFLLPRCHEMTDLPCQTLLP